jgi:hypothetical protein
MTCYAVIDTNILVSALIFDFIDTFEPCCRMKLYTNRSLSACKSFL